MDGYDEMDGLEELVYDMEQEMDEAVKKRFSAESAKAFETLNKFIGKRKYGA